MSAVPVIHCRGPEADRAWRCYSGLAGAIRKAPELLDDPEFGRLLAEYHTQFERAFEVTL